MLRTGLRVSECLSLRPEVTGNKVKRGREVPIPDDLAVAGNSPVYSHGCKSPLPVAAGVAGKPSCKTSGRILYFRYSSQG